MTATPRGFDAVSAPFTGKKSVFLGHHAVLHIVVDETSSVTPRRVGLKGGLNALHFTGLNGVSTLAIVP